MHNRIRIRWIETSLIPEPEIVGEVEIAENFNGVGESPLRRFVITKKQGSLTSSAAPGHDYLPKLTQEEQDRIEAMVRCYYEGVTHNKESISWMEKSDDNGS